MNKKQIALGMLVASFCASTMTSCGKYGSPEKYIEYAQATNNKNEVKTQESDNNKKNEEEVCNKTKKFNAPSVTSGESGKRCNVYGPPEKYNETKIEINND